MSEWRDMGINYRVQLSGVDESFERLRELDKMTDEVINEVKKTDRDTHSTMSRCVRTLRGIIGFYKDVYHFFGIALTPLQEAILQAITTTLWGVLTMHRVLDTGTFGTSAKLTMALDAIVIGMAWVNAAIVATGMRDAAHKFSDAEMIVADLLQMTRPWITHGGYMY